MFPLSISIILCFGKDFGGHYARKSQFRIQYWPNESSMRWKASDVIAESSRFRLLLGPNQLTSPDLVSFSTLKILATSSTSCEMSSSWPLCVEWFKSSRKVAGPREIDLWSLLEKWKYEGGSSTGSIGYHIRWLPVWPAKSLAFWALSGFTAFCRWSTRAWRASTCATEGRLSKGCQREKEGHLDRNQPSTILVKIIFTYDFRVQACRASWQETITLRNITMRLAGAHVVKGGWCRLTRIFFFRHGWQAVVTHDLFSRGCFGPASMPPSKCTWLRSGCVAWFLVDWTVWMHRVKS